MRKQEPLSLLVAGRPQILLSHVLIDFTGTLARDGVVRPGVAARLRRLSRRVKIVVATADTMSCAKRALKGLPIDLHFIKTGADKARLLDRLGASHVAAIGNGCNDLKMIRKAILSIAVVGPEGAYGALLAAADVVVHDVCAAFDLLLKPLRLLATLRE